MLGNAGANYQMQASTNPAVTNWTILGTMESTNGIWRRIRILPVPMASDEGQPGSWRGRVVWRRTSRAVQGVPDLAN
jgi:hypothetical protein